MSQGLIDTLYTYSQFSNMVFKHLPKIETVLANVNLIRDHGD